MITPRNDPPIGEPRVVEGNAIPVLYPGECARATRFVLVPTDDPAGGFQLQAREWVIEPMPGLRGWWLRFRWRVWGRYAFYPLFKSGRG